MLEVVYKKVDDLIPYVNNTRTHDEKQVKQIASSIKEFGFTNPILIDEENGIIAGHGRLLGADKLGLKEVPTITLNGLSKAQKKAYIIADNKLALNAGWNEELLKLELQSLKDMDFDITLTGFELDEIDLGEEDQILTDPEEVPEIQPDLTNEVGDIWLLGEHRLMCGDATNIEQIDKLMNGKKADLIMTDPPYNVAIDLKAGKIMNDDMSDKAFKEFIKAIYDNYFKIIKDGGVIYVFHADTERVTFTDEFKKAGFKLSQNLIWVKNSATLSRCDFNWRHEPCLYGWKEGSAHYFCKDFTLTSVIEDKQDFDKMKKEELLEFIKTYIAEEISTTIKFDKPSRNELHPTMKPIDLIKRMIGWSSKEKEIVVDFFGGSGSTLIASQISNRICYMLELDPKFADIIIRRWQELTGKEAINEKNGKTFNQITDEKYKK